MSIANNLFMFSVTFYTMKSYSLSLRYKIIICVLALTSVQFPYTFCSSASTPLQLQDPSLKTQPITDQNYTPKIF